jgi:hypothetical protein
VLLLSVRCKLLDVFVDHCHCLHLIHPVQAGKEP